VVLALLQIAIALTGNYGFFNLLTLVLLLPFVHDRYWYALVGWDHPPTRVLVIPTPPHPLIEAVILGGVVLLLVANTARFVTLVVEPRPVARLLAALRPWRLANSYGLFAVMTTTRPEITLEWSDDARDWVPYVLRWKPGPRARAPRWNQPHQPRLDWQMWFAALGSPAANPWFVDLCARLLEADPAVLKLFAEAPDHPPRFVRAAVERYRYTDPVTRRREGRWWDAEPLGPYLPTLTLRDGVVTRAEGSG
jgi:lipase maturation factor 1